MRAPTLTIKRLRELRKRMTPPERRLWKPIGPCVAGRPSWRKQHAERPYTLDFYYPEARLCVEVDGLDHVFGTSNDAPRTAPLRRHGIKVIRISVRDVFKQVEDGARFVRDIARERAEVIAAARPHHHPAPPSAPQDGPPPPLRRGGD